MGGWGGGWVVTVEAEAWQRLRAVEGWKGRGVKGSEGRGRNGGTEWGLRGGGRGARIVCAEGVMRRVCGVGCVRWGQGEAGRGRRSKGLPWCCAVWGAVCL